MSSGWWYFWKTTRPNVDFFFFPLEICRNTDSEVYCAPLGVAVLWEPSFLPHWVQYKRSIKVRSPQSIVLFFVWIKIKKDWIDWLGWLRRMLQIYPRRPCCFLLKNVDKIQAAHFVPDSDFRSFCLSGTIFNASKISMGCLCCRPHKWQNIFFFALWHSPINSFKYFLFVSLTCL